MYRDTYTISAYNYTGNLTLHSFTIRHFLAKYACILNVLLTSRSEIM